MMPPTLSLPGQQGVWRDQYHQDSRHNHAQFYDQSSPHFRRSYESPGSNADSKLKLKKAFKDIRDAPNAEKYECRSGRILYSCWKEDLKREVADLELEPSQWLDLLKVRTKGAARQAVQRACDLTLETSPAKACEMVWKYLDTAFQTTKKPSQSLIAGIINGPPLTLADLEGLTRFAQDCDSAQCLIESSPDTFLSLNEEMTQERIFDRLSPDMNREWFKHRMEKGHEEGSVPFEIFAKWINVQLKIELRRRGPDRNEKPYPSSPTTEKVKPGSAQSQTADQPQHTPSQSRVMKNSCKICGGYGHDLALRCDRFQKMEVREQWKACMPGGKGLCRSCLKSSCNLLGRCPERPGQCGMCRDTHHRDMRCKPEGMRPPTSPFNNHQQ